MIAGGGAGRFNALIVVDGPESTGKNNKPKVSTSAVDANWRRNQLKNCQTVDVYSKDFAVVPKLAGEKFATFDASAQLQVDFSNMFQMLQPPKKYPQALYFCNVPHGSGVAATPFVPKPTTATTQAYSGIMKGYQWFVNGKSFAYPYPDNLLYRLQQGKHSNGTPPVVVKKGKKK